MGKTRTATRTRVQTLSKTIVALGVSGAVLSSAAAGLAVVREHRTEVLQGVARPYQTVGYVPGYVPGYIPGQVPGYGVPGYVPGYGWFRQLTPQQAQIEFKRWVRDNLWPF